MIYGHCAEVRETEGKWLRVRGADGYEGWMHEGYCEAAEGAECAESGWDTPGEVSMGCRLRDSRGVGGPEGRGQAGAREGSGGALRKKSGLPLTV